MADKTSKAKKPTAKKEADTKFKAKKSASLPLEVPESDIRFSPPVVIQINNDGKWENQKPNGLDEKQLKILVQQLVNSKAIAAAQSYCCKCSEECKDPTHKYVPVIVMPLYPHEAIPVVIQGDDDKLKAKTEESEEEEDNEKASGDDKDKKKPKKRPFIMQRLTNFDLMSQW